MAASLFSQLSYYSYTTVVYLNDVLPRCIALHLQAASQRGETADDSRYLPNDLMSSTTRKHTNIHITLSEVNTDKFLALEIWHKGINAPSIRSPLLLLSCASSMGRHNRSATQQHHYLQSAAWTSHQQALSTDRNR